MEATWIMVDYRTQLFSKGITTEKCPKSDVVERNTVVISSCMDYGSTWLLFNGKNTKK